MTALADVDEVGAPSLWGDTAPTERSRAATAPEDTEPRRMPAEQRRELARLLQTLRVSFTVAVDPESGKWHVLPKTAGEAHG